MSEHERGAYAPPTADAPLSFDPRQPVRGSRPFPVTLIVSGLVLLGLVAAIFVFYRSGVREAGQPPQTVGAPVGDLKSPPPADAQPEDPAAGLQIYQAEGNQPAAAAPQFVAPPEQPATRAAPPATIVQPPPAAAPTVAVNGAALRPALPSTPPPAAPAAKPVAVQAPPPPSVASKPAAPKPAPPKPAPAAKPAPTSGGASVQIGAVSSTSLADKAWSEAVALAPGLAAGKGKGVERVDRDGKTLFRTTVTGFSSKTTAAAFCAKLKAAGKACFVK